MMRALAEFIMRSRLQAVAALLVSLFLPVLPQGIVGLITLRKGALEGILLIGITLVPPLIAVSLGKPAETYFWGTLLGFMAVLIPATVLRVTVSWSAALQASLAVAFIAVLLTVNLLPTLLSEFRQVTALIMSFMNNQPIDGELPQPVMASVTGFLGLGILFNSITGLLLARWWQSLLYNPGGFSAEFHQLRLGKLLSSLIFIGFLYSGAQGGNYLFWASIFAAPLVLVAIAIVHNLVRQRQLRGAYLVVFYAAIIAFSPILVILVIVGYADCWLDIRDRYGVSGSGQL